MSERTEEVWMYAGTRVGGEGKPVDAWIGPEGREVKFAPTKGEGYAIGSEYRATVTRAVEDGRTMVTLHGRPVYIGRSDDEDARAAAQAAHHAATTVLRLKRLEASDKRHSAIDEALAPLVELARKVAYGERDAFALYVQRAMYRVW